MGGAAWPLTGTSTDGNNCDPTALWGPTISSHGRLTGDSGRDGGHSAEDFRNIRITIVRIHIGRRIIVVNVASAASNPSPNSSTSSTYSGSSGGYLGTWRSTSAGRPSSHQLGFTRT